MINFQFNISRNGLQVPLAAAGIAGLAGASASTAIGIGGLAAMSGLGSKPKGIGAPPPRSYLGEMRDALNAQNSIQGQLLSQEAQWTPEYQKLQAQTLTGQMQSLYGLYGNAIPLSVQLQNQYAKDMQGVYSGVNASANTLYQGSLDSGTKSLYSELQRQAQADLTAGQSLTPEMQRQAQQSARAAMTARGLAGGNQGVAAEVLNSYNMGLERENRARQFAGSVYGAGIAQQKDAYSTYGATMLAGMQPMTPTGLLGTAGQQAAGLGTTIFQPESQYMAGVYGANQSNQMQAQMANAQANAGWSSGLMNMAGSLGGSILKNPNLFSGTPQQWTPQTGGYSNGKWYSAAD